MKKMAGSIQRIIPNTLSYSCDFSSPFNSDCGATSQSSDLTRQDSPVSSSSIVFDLREDLESENVVDILQLHELCANSESALRLESAPFNSSIASPNDTLVCIPPVVSEELCTERDTTRVSDLVDSLVGPSLMPTLSRKNVRSSDSTKPSSAATSAVSSPKDTERKPVLKNAIQKVFPVGRTPPKKPSRRAPPRTLPEKPRPLRIQNEQVDSPFVPFGEVEKTHSSFKCPDGWIPNHQCDDFCYSLFATSSKPTNRSRQFTSFPK